MSLSPQQVGLAITAAACLIGLAIAQFNRWRIYSGYREIQNDIRRLARSLGGEISRENDDVIIKGSYARLPITVRFSNADDMPGVMLMAGVPATFSMTIVGATVQAAGGGRMPVRTNDPVFDSRFSLRTNQPLEAKLFLTPNTVNTLKRLCCSGGTRLALERGELVLSEALVPQDAAQHMMLHVRQVQELSADLGEMPGAHEVKVTPFQRKRHIVRRAVIAIGGVAALVMLFTGGMMTRNSPPPKTQDSSGVLPIDARMIPNLAGWRVATTDSYDPVILNWMKGHELKPQGRIHGDFSGKGNPADVAYFLVSDDGSRRVVVLSEGKLRYDGRFDSLLGVVLLPKSDIDSIDWPDNRQPGGVDGDGLILIRKANEPTNDVVFFTRNGSPYFVKPLKYDNISVQ